MLKYFSLRPRGQAVKTPPFHGGIMGSIPVGVTKIKEHATRVLFYFDLAGIANAAQLRITNTLHRKQLSFFIAQSTCRMVR